MNILVCVPLNLNVYEIIKIIMKALIDQGSVWWRWLSDQLKCVL